MIQTDIVDVIKTYIELPQTDYAIMLNGKWGSGKTFFWKHKLVPLLNQLNRTPIYVSLYGISDINEIDAAIAVYLLHDIIKNKYLTGVFANFKRNKIEKCTNRIASNKIKNKIKSWCQNIKTKHSNNKSKFSGYSSQMAKSLAKQKHLEWIVKALPIRQLINVDRHIFCFDDFERARLKPEIILSYLNLLSEHGNAKIIIIGNEEELENKSEEPFKKYKEKTIGLTIKYELETNEVIAGIVALFYEDKEYYTFLSTQLETIKKTYLRSGSHNIRVLKNSLSLFGKLFDRIESIGKGLAIKYGKNYLKLMLAMSFESKSNTDGAAKSPHAVWTAL